MNEPHVLYVTTRFTYIVTTLSYHKRKSFEKDEAALFQFTAKSNTENVYAFILVV